MTAVMATRPLKWRILAIFTGPSVDSALFTNDPGGNGSVEEMVNLSGSDAEVRLCLEDQRLDGCSYAAHFESLATVSSHTRQAQL